MEPPSPCPTPDSPLGLAFAQSPQAFAESLNRFNELTSRLYLASQRQGLLPALVAYLAELVPGAKVIACIRNAHGTDFAQSETTAAPKYQETLNALPKSHGARQPGWSFSEALCHQPWHPAAWPQASLSSLHLENGASPEAVTHLHACVVLEERPFTEVEKSLLPLAVAHAHGLLRLFTPSSAPPGPELLCGLGLTPRERDVLYWVSEGKTNAEIGTILNVSQGTVRVHLENIYPKLCVENRISASRVALEKLHPTRFQFGQCA